MIGGQVMRSSVGGGKPFLLIRSISFRSRKPVLLLKPHASWVLFSEGDFGKIPEAADYANALGKSVSDCR